MLNKITYGKRKGNTNQKQQLSNMQLNTLISAKAKN